MNLLLAVSTSSNDAAEAVSASATFSSIDWLVVVGYLAVTTLLGGLLAGKQATIRDFFLGGRKLPWYAVSGSIIATEISAVTFVGVPAIMYAREGNLTYLQLGLFGSILARIVVGYVLVPAYYKREIYSPYDYMARELGGYVRTMTTALFTLTGMLAQGARVYLTAMVLELVLREPLHAWSTETGISAMTLSIWIIGVVAIAWTIMGGITTVIWTDVILFLVFFFGGFISLGYLLNGLGGPAEGFSEMITQARSVPEAGAWGKLTLFDFSLNPAVQFTFWAAIIANLIGCVAIFGTDQLMAQRMFCCKDARQARKAIIASSIGQIIPLVMLMVGLGLFTYYRTAGQLSPAAQTLVENDPDRIFPVFILQVIPTGIKGLLIAGIFAAAISSLDSILAALSQTSLSAFILPVRKRYLTLRGATESELSDQQVVRLSRVLVVFWGIILCIMAHVAHAASAKFPEILNLALAMAGYAGGALLAGFMLAFLRLRIDGRGFLWSAPLSVLVVFSLVWHEPWSHVVCWLGAIVLLLTWLWQLMRHSMDVAEIKDLNAKAIAGWTIFLRDWPATVILVAGLAMMLLTNYYGYFDVSIDDKEIVTYTTVAWPWFIPIGFTVAFVFGFLLARRQPRETADPVAA